MPEIEAIKLATLYLEGEDHDWRFHGISTLGHANVTAYSEFNWRLVERFDRREPEATYIELAKLKKSGNPKTYIYEFLKISIMVLDLFVARRVYTFIDGLGEPLHGLVRSTKPTTIQYYIERERDLQYSFPREKAPFQPRPPLQQKRKYVKVPPSKENKKKGPLSDEVRRD